MYIIIIICGKLSTNIVIFVIKVIYSIHIFSELVIHCYHLSETECSKAGGSGCNTDHRCGPECSCVQ